MSDEIHLGPLEGRLFDAVIFDMDGTLIDSTPAVERSWVVWAQHYGVSAEDLAHSHGMPSASIVAKLIPEPDRAAAKQFIDDLEVADTDDIVPLPGAVEALSALDDDRRAIATSCHRSLMEARVAASGIPRPAVIVTVDDVTRGKPNPDPFLLAAQRLGLDPSRCLVVEDAPSGLTGARAAGCATLSVVTTTAREHLHADAIVTDLSQVMLVQTEAGVRLSAAPSDVDERVRS